MLELHVEHHLARLRPATRRDALSRLRRHLAPIRDKPATAIGRREAAQVVDTAARADRGRLETAGSVTLLYKQWAGAVSTFMAEWKQL
ncbi:hypothetical protein [Crenalkalicoccus roseus]|uniref:hypothetical protein n=1 Tax=Crenalkalicoccus roseus TaxID=1485588 RepID=UPI001F0000FF|nr:hypothetical protein [Crenalkalicoccus roseus]